MNNSLSFKTLAWVALGGAIGASLRVFIGDLFHQNGLTSFPFHLVIVNIIGCLYLGLVAGLVEQNVWQPQQLWIQGSGIAGALTTFSAMAAISVEFWLSQNYLALASFLLVQLVMGLVFCFAAMQLVAYAIARTKK